MRQNVNVRLPMLSGSLRINAGITFTDANNIGDPAVVGAINNLMLQGTLAIDAMAVLDLSGSSLVEGGTIAQTYDFLSQAYVRVPGGASMTVGSGRMTLRTTASFSSARGFFRLMEHSTWLGEMSRSLLAAASC